MKKTIAISLSVILACGLFCSLGASFGSGIKSIQQGTGTQAISKGTITTVAVGSPQLTAVGSVAKCEVKAWVCDPTSWTYNTAGSFHHVSIAPHLSSTTNLNLYIIAGSSTVRYTWQVIEYY